MASCCCCFEWHTADAFVLSIDVLYLHIILLLTIHAAADALCDMQPMLNSTAKWVCHL
jgi:hypothetical protein